MSWFVDKLGPAPTPIAPAGMKQGKPNGKAAPAPQQAARQAAPPPRAASRPEPEPPKKKKGWF